jgi:hypothetical protein
MYEMEGASQLQRRHGPIARPAKPSEHATITRHSHGKPRSTSVLTPRNGAFPGWRADLGTLS